MHSFMLPGDRTMFLSKKWDTAYIAILTIVMCLWVIGTNIWLTRIETVREETHEKRLVADTVPPVMAAKDSVPAVIAGVYVERIYTMSIVESAWNVDFFLWFEGKGIDSTLFDEIRTVNGKIEGKKVLEYQKYTDTAGDTVVYLRALVNARITKFFSLDDFPTDEHLLTIRIEHIRKDYTRFIFIADTANTGVSSRVRVNGYRVNHKDVQIVTRLHGYQHFFGKNAIDAEKRGLHDFVQLCVGIPIRRHQQYFYFFKLFLGMFAAVFLSLLALWMSIDDNNRIALHVGSFFGGVAACYVTSGLLPQIGTVTIADLLNMFSISLISFSLLHSTICYLICMKNGVTGLQKRLDKKVFLVLSAGYAVTAIVFIFR